MCFGVTLSRRSKGRRRSFYAVISLLQRITHTAFGVHTVVATEARPLLATRLSVLSVRSVFSSTTGLGIYVCYISPRFAVQIVEISIDLSGTSKHALVAIQHTPHPCVTLAIHGDDLESQYN